MTEKPFDRLPDWAKLLIILLAIVILAFLVTSLFMRMLP